LPFLHSDALRKNSWCFVSGHLFMRIGIRCFKSFDRPMNASSTVIIAVIEASL
jgi:hypothetical protein